MKYERAEIVEKAAQVFWEKGYLGVGMRDLQVALDMRPGSIYAAFGSKDGLFCEALDVYAQQSFRRFEDIANSDSVLVQLRRFFEHVLFNDEQPDYQQRCFLVNTLGISHALSRELAEQADVLMKQTLTHFVAMLSAAHQNGEITEDKVNIHWAKWLQAQFIGLRVINSASPQSTDVTWQLNALFDALSSPATASSN